MKKIIATLIMMVVAFNCWAAEKEQEVDHVALATLMIYDGKYAVARDHLQQVDKKSDIFDAANYYTVWGVLESKEGNLPAAIEYYLDAVEATKVKEFKAPKIYTQREHLFAIGKTEEPKQDVPEFDAEKIRKEKIEKLYVYLSQAYYKTKDYRKSVEAIDLAGDLGRAKPALFAFRADCYWKLDEHADAINALNKGYALFSDAELLKQKYFYFAELGLYQSAVSTALEYMDKVGKKEDDYIMLAQMLITADETEAAISVLEEGKLHFPKNAKIGVLLSHSYLKKEMPRTGAHLLETSSYYEKKYLKDAVELYRRNRDYPHAIFLNSLMLDKQEKLKQKVAIYIDRGEFEKVIGLKDGLTRYGMLEDDNLRYALAYAYYMAKDYDSAEEQLKKISDNALFMKATVIRKNIEKCRDDSMECI